MKLVVGLGNPGARYAATRHNVGFRVADAFAAAHGMRCKDMAGRAVVGRGTVAGEECWVAEPQEYMNRSGGVVHWLLQQAGVGPESLLVLHDDLDLPLGQVRFKRTGGHGGHNGVRSIIETLGTNEFVRLKIGIGRPPGAHETVDFVLEPFSREEEPLVSVMVDRGRDAVTVALTQGVGAAMNRFHGSADVT